MIKFKLGADTDSFFIVYQLYRPIYRRASRACSGKGLFGPDFGQISAPFRESAKSMAIKLSMDLMPLDMHH